MEVPAPPAFVVHKRYDGEASCVLVCILGRSCAPPSAVPKGAPHARNASWAKAHLPLPLLLVNLLRLLPPRDNLSRIDRATLWISPPLPLAATACARPAPLPRCLSASSSSNRRLHRSCAALDHPSNPHRHPFFSGAGWSTTPNPKCGPRRAPPLAPYPT
jgi:hypothetical protein